MAKHSICSNCGWKEDCQEFLKRKEAKIKFNTTTRDCIGYLNGIEHFYVPHSKYSHNRKKTLK